jgi:hypothetical protein
MILNEDDISNLDDLDSNNMMMNKFNSYNSIDLQNAAMEY